MKTPAPGLFQSGRQFAAWIGLTPRDHSTAGKVRLGVITRAGDEALRTTLVAGATALIRQVQQGGSRNASPWLIELLKRKSPKSTAVALANKTARIAKLMLTGKYFSEIVTRHPIPRNLSLGDSTDRKRRSAEADAKSWAYNLTSEQLVNLIPEQLVNLILEQLVLALEVEVLLKRRAPIKRNGEDDNRRLSTWGPNIISAKVP